MNEMGLKEKAVMAVLGVVVLYAIAVATWFLVSDAAWRTAQRRYGDMQKRFAKEEKLISEKRKWATEYETAKKSMPTFDLTETTDTYWLRKFEAIAESNLVVTADVRANPEISEDEVLLLPIEVADFTCSLEALTKFLYELENSDQGVFNVTEISNLRRQGANSGYLRGAMKVTCAYMRANSTK